MHPIICSTKQKSRHGLERWREEEEGTNQVEHHVIPVLDVPPQHDQENHSVDRSSGDSDSFGRDVAQDIPRSSKEKDEMERSGRSFLFESRRKDEGRIYLFGVPSSFRGTSD